jgi:hypothetical protein
MFLEVSGDFWRYLEVSGGFRKFLEVSGQSIIERPNGTKLSQCPFIFELGSRKPPLRLLFH